MRGVGSDELTRAEDNVGKGEMNEGRRCELGTRGQEGGVDGPQGRAE